MLKSYSIIVVQAAEVLDAIVWIPKGTISLKSPHGEQPSHPRAAKAEKLQEAIQIGEKPCERAKNYDLQEQPFAATETAATRRKFATSRRKDIASWILNQKIRPQRSFLGQRLPFSVPFDAIFDTSASTPSLLTDQVGSAFEPVDSPISNCVLRIQLLYRSSSTVIHQFRSCQHYNEGTTSDTAKAHIRPFWHIKGPPLLTSQF